MKKSCSMYISSLYYNKEGWSKIALCIYHHFITTRKDEEKLRYVYIISSLQQGRIKKLHHFIITKRHKVKLQYVYIITSLQQGGIKKSWSMYISSLHYKQEGWRKVSVCIYHHFIITRKDEKNVRYLYIII